MKIKLLSIVLAAVSVLGCKPTVRVSPDGNIKTLSQAIDKVRQMRQEGLDPNEKVTVVLGDGVYFLNAPVEIDCRDSNIEIVAENRGVSRTGTR